MLSEVRCHLGEGPAYDAAGDTAWWFDILERRLFEARLGAGETLEHPLPVMASALAYVDDGTQLVVAEDGLHLRRIADGHLTLHVPIEADNTANRSNDARVHPSGTLWTSTMGCKAQASAGAIYALHGGMLSQLFANITIPNAICFSPDGATGYFSDTRENVLHRVPLDASTGLPVGAPSVLYRHHGEGGLDGAVTDAEGLIWCARWGAGCVDAYTPAGDRVRTVRVPARQTSCPVFVGADFSRMLVTSAYEDMDEAARVADPQHGRTFLLDVGARGRPEPRIRLGAI
jgi:sugar lactone lactonase YvrE